MVLGRVRTTLAAGAASDDIDGTVTTLLYATDALPKMFPGEPKRWLKERGRRHLPRRLAHPEAVRRAIADMQAAAVATVAAASVAVSRPDEPARRPTVPAPFRDVDVADESVRAPAHVGNGPSAAFWQP